MVYVHDSRVDKCGQPAAMRAKFGAEAAALEYICARPGPNRSAQAQVIAYVPSERALVVAGSGNSSSGVVSLVSEQDPGWSTVEGSAAQLDIVGTYPEIDAGGSIGSIEDAIATSQGIIVASREAQSGLSVLFQRSGVGGLRPSARVEARVKGFRALASSPDGSVWALGQGSQGGWVLLKLAQDNTVDARFGVDGLLDLALGNATGVEVAVDAEGRILLGVSHTEFAASEPGPPMTLTRLLATGARDLAFGDAGWVTLPIDGAHDMSGTLFVESSGGVVAAGRVRSPAVQGGIVRVDVTGKIDPAFGGDGPIRFEPDVDRNSPPGFTDVMLASAPVGTGECESEFVAVFSRSQRAYLFH